MEITVQQLKSLWMGTNAIYQVNEILPSLFDYHMKRNAKMLQSEIDVLQELDQDKIKEISGQKIEIPLSMITPKMLPEKMPNGALETLEPILEDTPHPEHKSAIADMLEEAV